MRLPNFGAIVEVVAGVGIAIMPARAAQRLQSDYDFHSIQLLGQNRKLLLATQSFNQLPGSYQQFADFYCSIVLKIDLMQNHIKS